MRRPHPGTGDTAVFARTAGNRRVLADFFAGLDDAQLAAASLCTGWTVRDVLGHLVMSLQLSFPRFTWEVVRDRGRVGLTSDRLAHQVGSRPVAELVATLRGRADRRVAAPGIGPLGPFADTCLHLRDAAVPLGIATTPPPADWLTTLQFLTTRRATAGGFLPRGRLDGLRLAATDGDWSRGDGPVVRGSAESLALAVSGRPIGLGSLSGDGVETLRRRISPRS